MVSPKLKLAQEGSRMLDVAMLTRVVSVFILSFLVYVPLSHSFETKGQDCAKCHTLSRDEARDLLKNVFPDIKVFEVHVSPSQALWEVFSESGGRKGLIYVDFSKKHVLMGQMVSIKEKRNLTQERFTDYNKLDLSQIPLGDALVMGDPQAKYRVIAFDDPD